MFASEFCIHAYDKGSAHLHAPQPGLSMLQVLSRLGKAGLELVKDIS